jgi:hypothetical protein
VIRIRLFASLFFVSLLCGCIVPYPHRVPSLPETPGLLLREGSPVYGVSVWHTVETSPDACSTAPETPFSTGETGEFILPGRRSWEFLVLILPVPADVLVTWTTCFSTSSAVLSWRSSSIGLPHPPETSRLLLCTLQADPPLSCNDHGQFVPVN